MLISERLLEGINQQIANELGASVEYIHIAAYFDSEDLLKFGRIFFDQADEEYMHAMKFVRYILEAGGKVDIPAFPKGPSNFSSAEEAVGAALAWEETVTKQINNLMTTAIEDTDYIGQDFLRWFVSEQLEEISKMKMLLGTIRNSNGNLLLAEQVAIENITAADAAEAAA